jgi:transposase
MADPIFKKYDPNQPTFLPPSLDELLGENHMVRFVNHVIDQMDLDPILDTYQGGGTSSYHPQMMLKILIFGYVERIHSCRAIAKATREQIPFMWLAAGHRPDFRTINHFRKHRLPDGGIKGVFTQVVQMLVDLGLVDLADYTVDGTTLEANARRHSAVWAKNTDRYKQSAIDRIEAYFDQIQQLADLEADQWAAAQAPEEESEPRWTADDVQSSAQKAEQALQAREQQLEEASQEADSDEKTVKTKRKDLSKARTRLRWITDNEYPKLSKYEAQERILGERNSYSQTDPDATFMRLKDQSPFDKLLAPAYNLQMGAQNRYILGYSLHSNAADKVNLDDHLDSLPFTPEWLCADGGYGSLYNFDDLAERGITAVIKAPTNHRKPNPYSRYAMDYHPEEDEYSCPQDRRMPLKETKPYAYGPDKQRTATTRVYECTDCSGCPVKDDCTYGDGNRTIQFTTELEDWKQVMADRMSQGKGKRMSRYRGMEIESIFGLLKANDGLNRLAMRGKKMVGREVGLTSIAHNIRQMKKDIRNGLLTHMMAAMNLQLRSTG